MVIANANIQRVSNEVKRVYSQGKQLVYSIFQGNCALVKKKASPKNLFGYAVCIYIYMLSVVRLSKS